MEGFEWIANNLSVATPQDLQRERVNVYFAPEVKSGVKVVDCASGASHIFRENQLYPTTGYYADYDDLARYCLKQGIPLTETNGQVSIEPSTTHQAGDLLAHGGA